MGSHEQQELVRRMRRVEAPEGFADRVMARAGAGSSRKPRVLMFRMSPAVRAWATGAIAAGLAVGVFAGEQAHRREQQRKAAEAAQQFETAIRVTDRALDQARDRLQRAGIVLGN